MVRLVTPYRGEANLKEDPGSFFLPDCIYSKRSGTDKDSVPGVIDKEACFECYYPDTGKLHSDSGIDGIMDNAGFQCPSEKKDDKGDPHCDHSHFCGSAVLGH